MLDRSLRKSDSRDNSVYECDLILINQPNETGHIYPQDMIEEILNGFLFNGDHNLPQPGTFYDNSCYGEAIDLAKVSHNLTGLEVSYNRDNELVLCATLRLLNTPAGEIAKGILDFGGTLYGTLRGIGEVDSIGKISKYHIVQVSIDIS